MKHPRLSWLIRSAAAVSGLAADGPEKQKTRHDLIAATNARRKQPPLAVFTYPGIHGFCVKAFREAWPKTRIIGIDRQMPAIRFTKAHWHPIETIIGPIENELLHAALRDYVERRSRRLYRVMRSGSKHRLDGTFDYPKFNMLFLDTTARFDTTTEDLIYAARMVDEHAADDAVIGVTVVLGSPREDLPDIDTVVAQFRQLVKRPTILLAEPTPYKSNTPMLFFLLALG